jgi:hypothetical protein
MPSQARETDMYNLYWSLMPPWMSELWFDHVNNFNKLVKMGVLTDGVNRDASGVQRSEEGTGISGEGPGENS